MSLFPEYDDSRESGRVAALGHCADNHTPDGPVGGGEGQSHVGIHVEDAYHALQQPEPHAEGPAQRVYPAGNRLFDRGADCAQQNIFLQFQGLPT